MKRDEVPQQVNADLHGERRALYAVDEAGRYGVVPSAGWDADRIVNAQAVDEYARLAREALARARQGLASPLEFHMYDRRMELPTLAQAAGLWRWRARRHLKPGPFAKLPAALLARYADALGLAPEALRRLPPEAP